MSAKETDSEIKALCEEAQRLYQSGQRDDAVTILEDLANKGVAFVHIVLGSMLLSFPKPDPVRAKFWLEKAAVDEIPEAFYGLGMIFLEGMGVEKSAHKAAEHFVNGSKLGDVRCSALLGEIFAGGALGECRHDFAIPLYWQAAKGGSALAQRRLGFYYSEGIEVEQDFSLAHDLYRDSAEQGDAYAANNLAIMYERGKGVEKDIDKAIEFYTIAAEGGIPTALQDLGACLANPEATHRNLEKAAYWFHKGAESGLKLSMLSLVRIYEQGEGVTQDLDAAEYWRLRSAQTLDSEIDGERQPLN